MRVLRYIFVAHWRYKVSALAISVILWGVVNFGSRTAVTLSRYVDIEGQKEGYVYKIEPERVDITVYVVERLLLSKFLGQVRAEIDVSGLEEGLYVLKARAVSPVPVLIHPTGVEPPMVRVKITRKRRNFRSHRTR